MKITEAAEAVKKAAYCVGKAVELEQAARRLLLRAGESFARGRDSDARMLREIANELNDLAAAYREEWEQLQPATREAWAFLESADAASVAQENGDSE